MTTQTTTLSTVNAATPAFYIEQGQTAFCSISGPGFNGLAAIERRVGTSAWAFVRQARDGDNSPLDGRDYYRVRITDLAAGAIVATFTIPDAATNDALLASANAHADTAAANAAAAAQAAATAAADSYADTKAAAALQSAQDYADSVAGSGGSGGFTLGTGGVATELAPAAGSGAWTLSGTVAPTQNAGGIHFVGASNLAAAAANVTLKDSTLYDVSFTVANYVGGSVRVLVYGATTAHAGATASVSANGNYTVQVTTSAAGSLANQIRVQATGTGNTTSLDITNISVHETGGATYPSRPMRNKMIEATISALDFPGVDNTGLVDSTTGLNAFFAYAGRRKQLPPGIYLADHLILNSGTCDLWGEGMDETVIQITGSGGIHGLQVIGNTGAGASNKFRLRDFTLKYVGTGQTVASGGNNNWSGLYVQRKIYTDNIAILGFTNDGIYFAPRDAVEGATTTAGTVGNAVFFCRLVNTWAKDNGRDGCVLRMGANANTIINPQFDRNKRYGLHQMTDGGSTYGNNVRDGQTSYNSSIGTYIESGTNLTVSGMYGEFNGSPSNTNTDGYTNTLLDFKIENAAVRTWFGIGTLFNNSSTHVGLPTLNSNAIQVWNAGQQLFGAT